ncbi:hypothetical protein [Pantoea endophytica]
MEWTDNLPDWQDDGKSITAISDSSEVSGVLYYDDFGSDGEGNEWPIWRIKIDSGETKSLFDFDKWKVE